MPAYKNITLLGASGNVGRPILKALLAAGQFNVTVLSRAESQAAFPSGANVVKTDFSAESVVDAFRGQDAVVSAIPSHVGAEQIKLIDAALKAGVKRFIASDFGSDVENPNCVEAVPFFQGKVQIVDYLRSKEAEGLSWSSVINGAFTEYGLEGGALGFDLKKHKATIYDSGDAKASTTTYANVGRSIVGILRKPDETANRYVHIASFVYTQNELLAVLEKVSGKKFAVEHSTAKQMQSEGLEALKTFSMPDVLKLLVYGIYGEGNGGDYALTKNDSELLGLEKEDLETVVRRIYEAQKQ